MDKTSFYKINTNTMQLKVCRMLKMSVLQGICLLVLISCGDKKETSEQPKKPNILFIVVDDLGYADLSVMGSTYYETPNIDRLASLELFLPMVMPPVPFVVRLGRVY